MKKRILKLAIPTVAAALIAPAASAAETTQQWRVDSAFEAAVGTGPDGTYVNSLIEFSDGDILAGGWFDTFNGTRANGLVRLNADGTLDTAFQTAIGTGPGEDAGDNGYVWTATELADGDILVGGAMSSFNSSPVGGLVRLNADGTLDTAFQTAIGTAANQIVTGVLELSDGDILVTGYFTSFNGTATGHVARLNADGTLDTAFQTAIGTAANQIVSEAIELSDGDILLDGFATTFNAKAVGRLIRLNADGTLDTAFHATIGTAANQPIDAILELSDGRILLGGIFTSFNGTPANRMIALNADGTADTTFQANIGTALTSGTVKDFVELRDGRIVVSQIAPTFNGQSVGNLVGLNTDGTVNTEFAAQVGTAADNGIDEVLPLRNGDFMAAGAFTHFNDVQAGGIARWGLENLHIDAISDQSSVVDTETSIATTATVTDGTEIVYAATGLPDGLSIDAATGVIAGTPHTLGTSTVTVTATNAGLVADTSFSWTVTAPQPTATPQPTTETPEPRPTTRDTPSSRLAATGTEITGIAAFAAALVLAGFFLRRRSTRI